VQSRLLRLVVGRLSDDAGTPAAEQGARVAWGGDHPQSREPLPWPGASLFTLGRALLLRSSSRPVLVSGPLDGGEREGAAGKEHTSSECGRHEQEST